MIDEHGSRPDPESRARTHFANDRTCLAWLRIGISLIALGLASAHFLDQDLTPGFPSTTALAAFLVIGGVAITATGGGLFIRARRQIERGITKGRRSASWWRSGSSSRRACSAWRWCCSCTIEVDAAFGTPGAP